MYFGVVALNGFDRLVFPQQAFDGFGLDQFSAFTSNEILFI
jgi:hypothetical protein